MCSMKKSKRALPGQAFIQLPACPEGLFLFLQDKKGLFIRVRL